MYSDIFFVVSKLWNEREKYIKTDYAVTGWMVCVINNIREDVFKMHKIIIIFRWILLSRVCLLDQLKKSYMKLSIRSGANIKTFIPLTEMNLSGIVKILVIGKIHVWHQKYSLPSTKVLGFVACRVTSKITGIWSAERSWGDVKTIKIWNRSALESEISENQSIGYTYACIEEARVGINLSHWNMICWAFMRWC